MPEQAKAQDKTDATAPAQPPVTVVIQQPDLAAAGAKAMEEGRALQMDKTVPGGRYRVGDQFVNADGEPIKKKEEDTGE
jgi:hypothetical protein